VSYCHEQAAQTFWRLGTISTALSALSKYSDLSMQQMFAILAHLIQK